MYVCMYTIHKNSYRKRKWDGETHWHTQPKPASQTESQSSRERGRLDRNGRNDPVNEIRVADYPRDGRADLHITEKQFPIDCAIERDKKDGKNEKIKGKSFVCRCPRCTLERTGHNRWYRDRCSSFRFCLNLYARIGQVWITLFGGFIRIMMNKGSISLYFWWGWMVN